MTAWWLSALPLQQTHDCTEHQMPQTPNCTVAATAADAVVGATAADAVVAATAADAVVVATPPFSIVADEVGAATAAAFPVPFTLFVPKLCIAWQEVAATAPKRKESKFVQEYRWDSMNGVRYVRFGVRGHTYWYRHQSRHKELCRQNIGRQIFQKKHRRAIVLHSSRAPS